MTIDAAARGMCEALAVTEDDRVGCVFPFTHIAGAVYVFSAMRYGCTMIVVEAFDAETTPPLLAANGVTLAGAGTPFHMAYLAYQRNHPESAPLFPHARAYIGGGAPKPPKLHHDIKAELGGVGIVSGYGMTEAPIVTMASVHDSDVELADTEGKPVLDTDLRLVTVDGEPAGPGQEGEIRLKAPMLMRGYVDASKDAEAFDEDGYFRTGDLGRFDDHGNVMITGRVKDIIIRNMENISAKEVEDLLFAHPAVADAAVVGLPDDRTGERVCAVVVPARSRAPPHPRRHPRLHRRERAGQAEDPRAARDRRGAAPEPDRQGAQVRAPRPIRGRVVDSSDLPARSLGQMRVVIGPVSRESASAWLGYARRIVDALGALAPDECFSTPEVCAAFDRFLTEWETVAASRDDCFLWEQELTVEDVEYHVHAFHQVASMLSRRSELGRQRKAPAEGEEFYAAVVRGALTALDAESPASSAFAEHLGEFWPGQELALH